MALDLDVNGSPDGKGGVVTGAFESVEAVVELASSVLEPTMIVRSGYGIQPYYLTKEVSRSAPTGTAIAPSSWASVCTHGSSRRPPSWRVLKIDSVFDLARLLRPPGSANGKGRQPQPVQLLDDGDRRYTLDELLAAGVDVEAGFTADEEADDRPPRSVEELLAVGKLGRIARHEGTPPKDSSDSGWDNYMACEAVRQGLSEAEFGLLLRFARHDDKKSRDEGYGRRTWAHARDEVGAEERPGQQQCGGGDHERYWLQRDPVVSGSSIGDVARGNAIMYLHRREGARLRIERLGDLCTATSHNRVMSGVTRSQFKALTPNEAVGYTQLIIELCGGEDADPCAEAWQWVTDFLSYDVAEIIDAKLWGATKAECWEDLRKRAYAQARLKAGDDPRTVVMRDNRGNLWLPATPLQAASGTRMDWDAFTARMKEIDWERYDADLHEPGKERPPKGDARRIHTVFYYGREDS